MKSTNRRTLPHYWLALFAGILLTSLPAMAAVVVTYDYTYSSSSQITPGDTDALVYTGPAGQGTTTKMNGNQNTSPWSVDSTDLSNGTLTLISNGTGGDSVDSAKTWASFTKPEWGPIGLTWTGWDAGNSSVVEFTARVNSQVSGSNAAQGSWLVNPIDGRSYVFFLGDGFVGFGTDLNGTDIVKYTMNTTDAFHTYQLELASDQANLYVDASSAPNLTLAGTTTSSSTARIEFGDLSTTDIGGSVSYQTLRWANNVPEPSVISLIGLGALALLGAFRKNRRIAKNAGSTS